MIVLIVSTHDKLGGAAIAAYRLMEALNKNGAEASMLVLNKKSNNPKVVQVGSNLMNKVGFIKERLTIFIKNDFSKKNLFDISIANTGVSIINLPEFKRADIIHLHWINQGMLSIKEIGEILATGKKVVWTMHDMWPFTGICHHSGSCNHFEKECGQCPYLKSPNEKDISYSTYQQKLTAYSKGKIHFVACSNWLRDLALKSLLTTNHKVSSIPNPINTTTYRPKDKTSLRKLMNLPIDKKIILFVAAKVSDKRKGIDYLIEASKILAKQENNYMFLIAGSDGEEVMSKLALPVKNAHYVAQEEMPNMYNVADVFVTPSLQENLPNTIMESMSCGTPCIGFNIGGIPEMIDHKQNGYIAQYKDAEDLANGIRWILDEADSAQLSENARNKVINNYSESQIAMKYLAIYNQEGRV